MKKIVLTLIAIGTTLIAFSQDKEEEKKFGITFSGFVKNDFFWDSRQTVAVREGHFLLWPSPVNEDVAGNDINAQPNLNMLAVQSRLTGTITGPDAFGARTSGVIEGDFFAQADVNINLFRLRHAFLKLSWEKTELLFGQYWNPLFVTGCFPGTVSFNTGTPLQSFARNPQIRLTKSLGNLKIMGAILSQRDYASRGVAGVSSSYLRNSSLPDMHLQIHYELKSESGTGFLAGVGGSYKELAPRLSSATDSGTFAVDERVGSMALIAFAKLSTKPVTVKVQARYGENIPDVLAIGGFAVQDIVDTITGEQSYTPLQNLTFWGEIHTNGTKLQAGVFGGFLLNMGAKEARTRTDLPVYGLAQNIFGLIRVSPRIIYNAGKVRLAGEVEWTLATYGSDYDLNYIPRIVTPAANTRVLLSAYYFF